MHSLYIHVPFCQKRCHYCSFYSTTLGKRERDWYVKALLQEMQARSTEELVTTIYFGGGTPSQLDAEELTTVFSALHTHFSISPDAEVTFECNPDDVVSPLPDLLASLGVNRISMGVQSFDDTMLRRLNRRHTAQQAIDAIYAFHQAGIHNVSIDLIYGLPGQTLDNFKEDVHRAVNLSQTLSDDHKHPLITHLSSYCLSIEEGTHLYNMRERGEITETDEETTLAMYDTLIDQLTAAGFDHYEISNFSLPGFHSRHNTAYWKGTAYTGLGPGAHSYDGDATRRWNFCDLLQYIDGPLSAYDEEHLSAAERYDELIMTRLRTQSGLPLDSLSCEQRRYLLRQAAPYLESGALVLSEENREKRLRLSRKGIFISDTVFSDLMCET